MRFLLLLPLFAQEVRVLDLTRPEPGPEPTTMTASVCATASSGDVRRAPALAVTLRVDGTDFQLGGTPVGYELEIQNVGKSSIQFPWAKLQAFSMRTEAAIDASLTVTAQRGDVAQRFALVYLRGITSVPGSTITLRAGEKAVVRLKSQIALTVGQLDAMTMESSAKLSLRGEVWLQSAPCRWDLPVRSINTIDVTVRR